MARTKGINRVIKCRAFDINSTNACDLHNKSVGGAGGTVCTMIFAFCCECIYLTDRGLIDDFVRERHLISIRIDHMSIILTARDGLKWDEILGNRDV